MRTKVIVAVTTAWAIGTCGVAVADGMKKDPLTRAARPSRAAPPAPAAPAPQPAAQTAPAPEPPTQSNWTGGQFGGQGGGSQLAQNFVEPGSNLCPTGGLSDGIGPFIPGGVSVSHPGCPEYPFAFGSHPAGGTIGAFLGYRMQIGSAVVGVEGDVNYKRLGASSLEHVVSQVSGVGGPFEKNEQFYGAQSQRWDGSLRLRAGVLATPDLLIYGTGGIAVGELCGSYSYAARLNDGGTIESPLPGSTAWGQGSWCDTRVGYTAGGGAEWALGMGIKARIEYRFTDFGDYTKNVPLYAIPAGGSGACGANFNCNGNARIDLTENAFHAIRIGIGFDF